MLQTNRIETTSVRALFWGEQCVTWHILKLRSIGLSIPSHYQHFDRQSVLNRRYSTESHYLGNNVIEINGATPHSDMSTYAVCYCVQTDLRLKMNTGFTEVVCNNVWGWFGPVVMFATDPANHMRNAITDDAELAMDAISWYAFICLPTLLTKVSSYIRSKPFPFRFFYKPPSPIVTVSFRSDITMPNEIISNICSMAPLSILMGMLTLNKTMKAAVNFEFASRAKKVVYCHLDRNHEEFVSLISNIKGVYTGYSFLEFANGV